MKFKAIIGAAVVLGTMMFASVTAHAATFKAGTSSTPESDGSYAIPITVSPDTAGEKLNGVIIEVSGDENVELVSPGSSYATMGTFCTESGISVSGEKDGAGVVGWAIGEAKPITDADTELATFYFRPKDANFKGTADITVTVKQVAYNATALGDAGKEDGAIIVSGTVSVLFGDVDGDEKVTSTDAVLVLRHSNDPTVIAEEYRGAADVDADTKITSTDAVLILRRSNDSTVVFPAEQ